MIENKLQKDDIMKGKKKKQLYKFVAPYILIAFSCSVRATESPHMEMIYGRTLSQCRTELELLKPLDMSVYQQETKTLNSDLGAASRYLLIRNQLNPAMQETLDRLHQANLMRTCQQIHNVLFNQLLNKSAIAVSSGEKGA